MIKNYQQNLICIQGCFYFSIVTDIMKAYYMLPVFLFCVGLYTLLSYNKQPSDDNQEPKYEGPLYLSSYIKQGNIEEGRLAAKVGPPFDVFAEPNYAGYITVNETTNSNLFFWFFVAEVSIIYIGR